MVFVFSSVFQNQWKRKGKMVISNNESTEVDLRGRNVAEEIEEDPILFTSKIPKK